MWITDRENNFLGGVKPTGYKDIYPDGRQTVKKYIFPVGVCSSLSTSSRQGNRFFPVGGLFPHDRRPSEGSFSLSVLNHQEKYHP
jgi:hypothetical protein